MRLQHNGALIAILYILLLTACNESKSTENNQAESENIKATETTEVSGKFANATGNETLLFFQLSQTGFQNADTVRLSDDGSFSLSVNVEEIGFYRLQINQQNFTNLILKPNDQVQITGNIQSLEQGTQIQGSEETKLLRELNGRFYPYYKSLDSLQRLAQQYQQQGNAMGYSAAVANIRQLDQRKTKIASQFIDDYPSNFASIAAAENLDVEKDFEVMRQLANGLKERYPEAKFTKDLVSKVETAQKLSVGAKAPNIELANPQGEVIPLASLEGKVVLIDFWASWCKPCRMENPNVKRVYAKYKDKGFEIYGVSLDKNKQAWVKAIQQDGLPWVHVSDLGFWNSSVVPLYNVSSIPKTVLLNEKGEIIAKNLRGAALEKKLAEVFGG